MPLLALCALTAVTLLAPLAWAVPYNAADVNTPAHKRKPGLRIIGAPSETGQPARFSSLRVVSRSQPRRKRGQRAPVRFDPHVHPTIADSYAPEWDPAGDDSVETIPNEAIRIDPSSDDYVGGEYADEGYTDPSGDDCGRSPGIFGFGRWGRWTPIENLIAKSWDHDTVGESWLVRPYYIGGFVGAMFGDTLKSNEIDQRQGFFGGIRLGWDFMRNFSAEGRLAKAAMPVTFYGREGRDNADVVLGDIDLLWYPWGDTPWRPYVLVGFGFAQFQYRGLDHYKYDNTVFGIPWGIGFRYRWTPSWACRFELLDNVAFGGSELLDTMNNVTLTGGVEYRFGGSYRTYWPWDPGRQRW